MYDERDQEYRGEHNEEDQNTVNGQEDLSLIHILLFISCQRP